MPHTPRVGARGAYAFALAAPLCALAGQLLLGPAVYTVPFTLFFLAVAAASWVGGLRPGLVAMVLSAALGDYFFLTPVTSFGLTLRALLPLGLFLTVSTLLCLLNASLRGRDRERDALLAQARAAVVLRDEFLQVAAHELRTPLTALRLQLRSLARGMEEDAHGAGRVAAAERSALRLQALVESLLDVARLESGRLELAASRLELGPLLKDVLARLEPLFTEAGSSVRLSLPAEPLEGVWDAARVEQVLVNLLANAAKYGAGRPVHVGVRREGLRALVTVRDEGPGISPEVLPRLFGRFERGVPVRHYGGLGLGLHISRQLVEAMGGSLEAHSVPGQGATFTVALPLEPLAATGSHSVLAGG
nr:MULTISPECIES: HAMP domain-containing sensor histidine kinase [Myxococcaceae]